MRSGTIDCEPFFVLAVEDKIGPDPSRFLDVTPERAALAVLAFTYALPLCPFYLGTLFDFFLSTPPRGQPSRRLNPRNTPVFPGAGTRVSQFFQP